MSLSRRRLRTAKQRQCNKLRTGKSTVCIVQKALAAMSDNLKIGLVPHENDEETT